MSERSYFSFKWAIPGFTFILVIISLNHQVIIQSIGLETGVPVFAQLFFGLLAILSGSGIGFLISQIWHWVYESQCYYYGAPRKPYQTTIELYKLEKGFEKKTDKKRVSSFFVYLLSTYSGQKHTRDLLVRRGDLYHLFGSEILSLFVALGWSIRIISHYRLGKTFIFCGQNWWSTTEWNILFFTTLFTIIFIILLIKQFRTVSKEYNVYADIYVKKIVIENKNMKLDNIFSREYFSWPLYEIDIPIKYEEILNKIGIDSVYKLAKCDLHYQKKITSEKFSEEELEKWMDIANKFLNK